VVWVIYQGGIPPEVLIWAWLASALQSDRVSISAGVTGKWFVPDIA